MTIHFGDFQGYVTSSASAYPISYSGSGLFDMSPLAAIMMDYLPSYFLLGNNNRRIMELIAVVLDHWDDNIDDLLLQFFVETATWGLKYWEELVGLPINDGNLDYETRRAAILAKLRDCSSEECFVDGMESVIGGKVIVVDLDPVTNPYQISIELRSVDVTYAGPKTAPTASVFGVGDLDGDYTYRVTYEYTPIAIPNYITLFPYTNGTEQTTGQVLSQRQYLIVSGAGTFYLEMAGVSGFAGPFNGADTAQDIVDGLNTHLEDYWGPDAVSTPFPTNVANVDGIILIFDGIYTKARSFPPLKIKLPSSITGNVVIVNDPEFFQPDNTGETPSGIMPTKTDEIQTISSPSPGLITGGTFTIKRNIVWDEDFPSIFEETAPLPFDATAEEIQDALEALPSVYPNTLLVSGLGSFPAATMTVEYTGIEAGFPQQLLVIDNSQLVGGGFFLVNRTQSGSTTYSGSESNTVSCSGNSVILQNVPVSVENAGKRNIYRKKTEAPYNEWRYVGSIDDNYSTVFYDDVPDVDLSETQQVVIFGNTLSSYKLRLDSVDTVALDYNASPATVKAALEAVTGTTYPQIGVTVTGVSTANVDGGLEVKFDGGTVIGEDVSGKDIPKMEVIPVSPFGTIGYVITTGPRVLTERNTAFTYAFQRLVEYIFVTKPAHLRIRELRSAAFRASINSAGDPV